MVEEIGRYVLQSGGKRLRPLLVLLVSKLFRYAGEQHIKLAAAIEFLHTATLLHDDIIDKSKLRRNQPTVNVKWGDSPGVLAGDFLYSRAFQIVVDIGEIRILQLLSEATNMIIEGEIMQLTRAGDVSMKEEHYREIIHRKTAILFQAAAQTAAVLNGIPISHELALRNYGMHLGMSYQLVDDMLDYYGDTAAMGKNLGDDLAEGNLTLPIIYTLSHGNREQQAITRHAIESRDISCLDEVAAAIRDCGALNYTQAAAEHEYKQCMACLTQQPCNRYHKALEQLSEFVLYRKY